jgi:hypothetical protein
MSCWAVPSVAAELWGCSVESVLQAIRNGDLRTRQEAGWTFVDVDPDGPSSSTEVSPSVAATSKPLAIAA